MSSNNEIRRNFRRISENKLFVLDFLQKILYLLEYQDNSVDYSCVSGRSAETPTSLSFITSTFPPQLTDWANCPETGSSERQRCERLYAAAHSSPWFTIYWSRGFTGSLNLGQLPRQHSLCWLIKGKDGRPAEQQEQHGEEFCFKWLLQLILYHLDCGQHDHQGHFDH